jgi:hypothetical protein
LVARALPAARVRALPAWAWLTGIVVLSVLFRLALARRMVAPWIMVDELLYSELAKSFAEHGRFLVRGEPSDGLGIVYPVLIAPAYRLFGAVPDAYAAAKAINSVLMSLAAVPAYLLARRVVRPGLALVGALLAVAVPSMVYTGTLMTENVFYPLFLCAALLLVVTLERPTLTRQAGLVALCGLLYLTRAQAVAVVPAVLTAPLLYAGRGGFRLFRWSYGIVGGVGALLVAVQLARGRSLTDLLGAYSAATDTHYTVASSFRWLLYHLGELDLYLGVAPFFALVLLAVLRPHQGRAFLSAAVALSGWLVLEVSVFASSPFVSRIEERNMFYVAPLLFTALLLWIELGMPRPRAAAVSAVVSAALVGVVPYSGLLNGNATSDTLAFLPLWTLQDTVITLDEVAAVVVLGAIGVAAALLLLPTRWALALPAFLLVLYALSLQAIETNPHGGIHHASVGALYGGITRERDWVDRAVGRNADVAFVWSGNRDKFTLWENEFFNRSVGDVYDLGSSAPGGLPTTEVSVDPATGRLRGAGRHTYVLTDTSVNLAGVPVETDEAKQMALYLVAGPLRVRAQTTGIFPDSWSGAEATYTAFACRGGTLVVELQSDKNLHAGPVTVSAAGRSVRVPPNDQTVYLRVPLHPVGGRCVTRFAISPTAVPGPTDPRALGAHFNAFFIRR